MKTEILEYYPNGYIKHKIYYYSNGNKSSVLFYDEYGNYHRENGLPAYQKWYSNGKLKIKTYCVYGKSHNSNNPSYVHYLKNGKIHIISFYLNNRFIPNGKLDWQNQIKNI